MHGVRSYAEPPEEDSARFISLAKEALETCKQRDFSSQALSLVNRVLELNPDEYSLWNYHKRFVLNEIEKIMNYEPASFQEAAEQLFDSEFELTQRALYRHPKAYSAWQHRIFLLKTAKYHLPSKIYEGYFKKELEICAKLLDLDDRNFHGWAHRMRVGDIRGLQPSREELQFVTERIYGNFSNYSAWHHRSRILPILFKDQRDQYYLAVQEDLELVKQAIFTEPEDQSAWFYFRWLLRGAPSYQTTVSVLDIDNEILKKELCILEELLTLEPKCKWALLTKFYLLQIFGDFDNAETVLTTLQKLDPLRNGYYMYLKEKMRRSS
ncbi:Geranylgeranyl transferase type-2 subunit alpha [Galdieria sulphuraria]|uniref:Geranylgeranyl transferase type-2 subunit alpha n=1 Tax=Galdieria sulphuraria TaxID=130081 RepID=M2Y9D7_GALSU|nr:protein geranylgeranyltransferase type II [Galdieria sulphuraria]EME32703.1 protein geranylgeranyltransferase type II [Galdieria sulphuraria]GJD07904.1 Geranylgeranyl transferase type-2 subunit alpha [Galdieria sulphuraria]|eukprot:XP_005709223.1 protein geranylgeranyltransferase type II [Galdieria sulphuraria]